MSAKVQNNTILETGRRPEWRYPLDHATNPGEIITDDSIYRAGGIDPESDAAGWYTISDENKPSFDPATEHPPQPKPQSEWEIKSDRVVRTWNAPVALTQDELDQREESRIRGLENRAKQRTQELVAAKGINDMLDTLPDSEVEAVTFAFPAWSGDSVPVQVDQKFRYDGVLYKVLQAHTTQPDWAPPDVPALFTRFRDPSAGPQAWVQPNGAHDAYNVGDRVAHNGSTWESDVDGNVWEPPTQWTAV